MERTVESYAARTAAGRARRLTLRTTTIVRTAWHEPVQRRIGFALAAAIASAVAFARVAEDYVTNDPLARWDVSFARWLSGERTGAGTDAFRMLTNVGSPAGSLAIATVVCVVLYRRRQIADAALLPLVLAGAEALNLVLKLAFHRPRPEPAFVHLDTYSFPSGHAMIATAAYGAFAYLAWGRLRTRRERLALVAGTVTLVGLICFSRLYLGVHYLSDVLAGIAGGSCWLALAIALQIAYGPRFSTRFSGSALDGLGRRITRS